jgi:hypothetical protein
MRDFKAYTILDAKAATGIGNNIDVSDFRHLVVSFSTASSGNLTVKFCGSIEETCPNFAAAQSVTNMYDFLECVDLQSGSAVAGDTGLAVTGTDDNRLVEINTDGMKWFNARVTARSAGSVTCKILAFRN